MKFRYYITDTLDGSIKGTSIKEVAKTYSESEDFFVVDSETGEWFTADEDTLDVEEILSEE